MRGSIHSALGISCGCIIAYSLYSKYSLSIESASSFAISCAFSSTIVDLDSPTSSASHNYVILSFITRLFCKHRGILHTPFIAILSSFFLFIMSFFISHIFMPISIGYLTGYLLHLIQDTFTPVGIAWLFPFTKKHYSLLHSKTNILKEVSITAMIIFLIGFIFLVVL